MLRLLGLLFWLFTPLLATDLSPAKSHGHIFVFHRFDDSRHASTSVSTHELKKLFEYLKERHFHVATLQELQDKLQKKEPIPNNWVWFTIDDSYKSFYTHGFPLFKKYHIPFTLYVYVEATNRHFGDFMRWDEIRELMPYGTIGLHSYGHKHLTTLSDEAIKTKTQKALKRIKKELGITPSSYAYPYGEYDERVKKLIKSFGFALIMNQNVGAVSEKTAADDIDRIALMGKIHIKSKLAIKHLPAIWHQVKIDRKKRVLQSIELTIDPKYKSVQLYVSGSTWRTLKIKKGKISKTLNQKLKLRRSRIIIKTKDNAWTSHIILL